MTHTACSSALKRIKRYVRARECKFCGTPIVFLMVVGWGHDPQVRHPYRAVEIRDGWNGAIWYSPKDHRHHHCLVLARILEANENFVVR